jgi:thymidylate synthase ThyX
VRWSLAAAVPAAPGRTSCRRTTSRPRTSSPWPGKVCYDSYGVDGNPVGEARANLVDSGHHSVLEHVHVGVFIEGISRGCSHEIVRHRMFNYSQRSTRYTAEDDAAIVLDPYYAELYIADANELASSRWSKTLLAFPECCEAVSQGRTRTRSRCSSSSIRMG